MAEEKSDEQEKLITQDVVYICEPLTFDEKQESSFLDSAREVVDKVMPESKAGKIAVGGGLAALAFAAIPAGIVGTLAAGGIAAGVAGVNALLGKDEKKETAGENPHPANESREVTAQEQAKQYTIPQVLALAKKHYKADKKVNLDDIAIVPSDVAKTVFAEDGAQLKNVKRLTAGMILIKHPFLPNTYITIDTTEKELFLNKQLYISRIMQHLGAKSVRGQAKIVESKRRMIDAKGKVTYEKVKLDIGVKNDQNQHDESEYKIRTTFSGNYSAEDYALAVEEATRYGLSEDYAIKSLIEQRNPEKLNPMQGQQEISVEISRELNKALDTAISLETIGVGLGGEYTEILNTSNKISFELEVQF